MTVPNMISSFRFVAAPALLWLAWHDYYRVYIAVLCLSFLSDAMDGYIARKLKQESQLGTLLDTWADIVIYITLPISAWWLWPEIMRQQIPFVSVVIISYTLPGLIGMLKFGVLTIYGQHVGFNVCRRTCLAISSRDPDLHPRRAREHCDHRGASRSALKRPLALACVKRSALEHMRNRSTATRSRHG
jgi:VanZ family protein